MRGKGCFVARLPQFETGIISISGSWEDYLASRSSGFRKKLRKAARKAGERGDVKLERVSLLSGESGFEESLNEALEIEQRSWKGSNQTAINSLPEVRQTFVDVVHHCAAAENLEIHFLKIGGKRVAFDIGLISHGTWYSYKVSYDPGYADCSPGQLLTQCQLQYFFRTGRVRLVDTVGVLGEATGKWCTENRMRYRYLIATGGPLANLAVRSLIGVRWIVRRIRKRRGESRAMSIPG